MVDVDRREVAIVAILLIIGFLVRIGISNNQGFAWDVLAHKMWAQSLYKYGLPSAYEKSASNLPPVFIYILYLLSPAILKLKDYSFLFIKLPGIISDIGISIVIYLFAKRKLGAENSSKNSPLISMTLFLFNPAIIFASAIWGKWDDSLLSLFLLLTIYYHNNYKEGIFYALSILTKLHAIILAPILVRRINLPRLIIPFALTIVLLLLPFLPHLDTFYERVFRDTLKQFPHITINAYNFWWLFNWTGMGKEWFYSPSDTKAYYFIVPKYFGLLIFISIYILLLIYIRQKDYRMKHICFASFFIYFASFMFLTRIHERYMFYCLPFLALLVNERRFLYTYIILSITFFLNLYFVYEQNYPTYFPLLYKVHALTIGISLVNLSVFIYMLAQLSKRISSGRLNLETP